jgi:hypothetical protein
MIEGWHIIKARQRQKRQGLIAGPETSALASKMPGPSGVDAGKGIHEIIACWRHAHARKNDSNGKKGDGRAH